MVSLLKLAEITEVLLPLLEGALLLKGDLISQGLNIVSPFFPGRGEVPVPS